MVYNWYGQMMNGAFGNWMNATTFRNAFFGGAFGALLMTVMLLFVIVLIALYVYFALAWRAIARKRGYKKSWLAWIPIANLAMWLQMGGFSWLWIFLVLIPVLGWIPLIVLFIISSWRVFEKLKYPGWWSLAILVDGIGLGIGTILYGVAVGVVAWSKNKKR